MAARKRRPQGGAPRGITIAATPQERGFHWKAGDRTRGVWHRAARAGDEPDATSRPFLMQAGASAADRGLRQSVVSSLWLRSAVKTDVCAAT
ncbi:hypothetical protein INQ13_22450 [Escherichia coli]|nr:hypothetical protein [Escherichia coli]